MRRKVFSLRRLRWKLTLSYTLVTVAAVLLLELIVFSVLAVVFYSSVLANTVAEDMRSNLAPRLEQAMVAAPPDRQALREELRSYVDASFPEERPEEGEIDFSFGDPEGVRLFVVDDERQLLAHYSGRNPGQSGPPEDEAFDAARYPVLGPPLDAALAGERDPDRLSARADGKMLAAVPLRDGEGQVTGALVSVAGVPPPGRFAGRFLGLLGVSAVVLAVPAAVAGALFGFFTAGAMTRRLQRLARTSSAWSRGDFDARVGDRSGDELGQLGRELDEMAVRLEGLLQTRQKLAALETRDAFARDLHDSVKQQVYATALHVDTARALLQTNAEAAGDRLARARELLGEVQSEVDVLIHEMRPAGLEEGLAVALSGYAARWSSQGGVPVEVRLENEREAPPGVEEALFRVAQEALANVAKHSGAGQARVDLVYEKDALVLSVSDDGRGFDPAHRIGGFGLRSMEERLAAVGGSCEVVSSPGGGTRVRGVCPLDGGET